MATLHHHVILIVIGDLVALAHHVRDERRVIEMINTDGYPSRVLVGSQAALLTAYFLRRLVLASLLARHELVVRILFGDDAIA